MYPVSCVTVSLVSGVIVTCALPDCGTSVICVLCHWCLA